MKTKKSSSYVPYYAFIALAILADLFGVGISIVQSTILTLAATGVGAIAFLGAVIVERISDTVLGTGNPFTGIVGTIFISQFLVSMFMLAFALSLFVVHTKDRVGPVFIISLIFTAIAESIPFLSAGPVWTFFGVRKLLTRIALDKWKSPVPKNDV